MTDPKPPFALSAEDKQTALWKKLMGHFGDRLDANRLLNDSMQDEVNTARTRGRISAYKELLALNDAPRITE
jgi:hypothetical protein